MARIDKQREEFERRAQERQQQIAKAFRAFGAAIAQAMRPDISMETCPHCGQERVANLSAEIKKAAERGRRRMG